MIATQNPVDLAGTYPLPDSQLDRFLLRLALGYPDADAERALLAGSDRRDLIAQACRCWMPSDVLALRRAVAPCTPATALVSYVQALMQQSRRHPGVRVGLSPRAGLAPAAAARAPTRCSSAATMRCPRTCRRCSPRWPRTAWCRVGTDGRDAAGARASCTRWRSTDAALPGRAT